jgi:hypothetical protein
LSFSGTIQRLKTPLAAALAAIHNLFVSNISTEKTDESLIFRMIRDEFIIMAKTALTTLTKAAPAPVFFDAAQA